MTDDERYRALRDAWFSTRGTTPDDLATFILEHADLAAGVTITGEHRDQLLFPDGRIVDVVLGKLVAAIIMESDDLDLK